MLLTAGLRTGQPGAGVARRSSDGDDLARDAGATAGTEDRCQGIVRGLLGSRSARWLVRRDPGAGPEFGGRFQQAIADGRVGREVRDRSGAGHPEPIAHGNQDRHDDRRDDQQRSDEPPVHKKR